MALGDLGTLPSAHKNEPPLQLGARVGSAPLGTKGLGGCKCGVPSKMSWSLSTVYASGG